MLNRGNCNTARAILRPVCSSACQDRAISVSVDVQEQVTLPKHNWRLTIILAHWKQFVSIRVQLVG